MLKLNEPLANAIRARRSALRFTQSEIARNLDITQAAISQVEQGELKAVSPETLQRLLKLLDISDAADSSSQIQPQTVACCPNPGCPVGIPFIKGTSIVFRPQFYQISPSETRYCTACGSALVTKCQTPSCSEPLVEGASHCSHCGDPYCPLDLPIGKVDIVRLLTLRKQEREYFNSPSPTQVLPKKTQNKNITSKQSTQVIN